MRHIIFNYGRFDRNQENSFPENETGDVFKLSLNFSSDDHQCILHYFSYAHKHVSLFKDGQSPERTEIVARIFDAIVFQTDLLKKSGEEILILLHMGNESDLSFVYEDFGRLRLPSVRFFHGGVGLIYDKIIDSWSDRWATQSPELLSAKAADLKEVWDYYFSGSKSALKL